MVCLCTIRSVVSGKKLRKNDEDDDDDIDGADEAKTIAWKAKIKTQEE